MQSNHARIKRSSGSSRERRRRRERTGKADRTELTLTDHLLLNSSCEPPGPSFHAFHCGAPTPQVRDPGTPSQCGSGRSYSLRICTRFWLNARTHARTLARTKHTHIYSDCCCWWEGSLIVLAAWPSSLLSLLSPLGGVTPVGHFWNGFSHEKFNRCPPFFRRFLPLSLPSLPGLPHPWFVKSIMQIAHVLHTARKLRTSVWTFLTARATGWHQHHGANL